MDMLAYAELFQAEAQEYMQVLNRCLLNLEKEPRSRDNLQEAFRAVHSLKGMAGTMGYRQVTDIAHGLENFLEELKMEVFEPSAAALDLVFEAVDLLELALAKPEEPSPGEHRNVEQLLLRFRSFQQGSAVPEEDGAADNCGPPEIMIGEVEREIIRQAFQRGEAPTLIRVALRQDTVMKSVRSYMVLCALEEMGEIICTVPSRQDLDEENFDCLFQVGLILNNGVDPAHLEDRLQNISDVEQAAAVPWPEAGIPGLLVENNPADQESTAYTARNSAADKMVRVETQKLDDLVNLVGEMVVARTRIGEIGRGYSEDLDNTIDQLKRAITNLQDTAMKLRMVPVKQVFDRFPRMLRDLCREKNKLVQLNISGENTELDRSVINQLSDPLVHLLRNAVDHGIEMAETREAAGKNPTGTVCLNARHEGNQIVITVEDDGAGIDPKRVIKKALHKGMITQADAARISDEGAVQLIFRSGFSTTEQVTDLSGRGVGMDVVRKSIEALHGSIDVESIPGEMTRVVLRLPLTLAIIKALLVRSGGQVYAIPLELVRSNAYLEPEELKTIRGNLVVNLRGEVIPLYDLSGLLGFRREGGQPGELSVVIVESNGKTSGFIVDELIGQQEIMIKSIGGFLNHVKGIAGATILGDGSVSLIVDAAGLIENGRGPC